MGPGSSTAPSAALAASCRPKADRSGRALGWRRVKLMVGAAGEDRPAGDLRPGQRAALLRGSEEAGRREMAAALAAQGGLPLAGLLLTAGLLRRRR